MTWSSMADNSILWRFFYHDNIHFNHLFFSSLWSIVFEKTVDLSSFLLLDQAQDLPTQPSLSTGGLAGESLCWGRAAVWRETGDPIRLRVRLHGPPSPMPPMHTQPFLDPPWLGCCPWLLIWPSWSSCPFWWTQDHYWSGCVLHFSHSFISVLKATETHPNSKHEV